MRASDRSAVGPRRVLIAAGAMRASPRSGGDFRVLPHYPIPQLEKRDLVKRRRPRPASHPQVFTGRPGSK
jgi:hypothetical protein